MKLVYKLFKILCNSIRRIRETPRAAVAMDESAIKGLEGLELNGSDSGIRNSSVIRRMVVKGYDTSPPTPREDVEEALRKHFASRGINLIHAAVPVVYDTRILCRYALIYVNEESEAEALKLDGTYGSDMGRGRILEIAAYPFDDNSLDHVFVPTKATDQYLQRGLKVSGFDTSLASEDDIKKIVRELFPRSGCLVLNDGCVLLYLHGQDAIENALKISGSSVRGFKIAVDKVLPIKRVSGCISPARRLALAQGNQKTIMATD